MPGEELETVDESRISRRKALKAGVGVGVGALVWTGPTITSMAGTPAYADACTFFTLNIALTDLSTNQSGCDTFTYNNSPNLNLKIPDQYEAALPNRGNFHCADTEACYTFTFPVDEYCRVEVKVAENGAGLTGPYYGETSAEGTGGSFQFCLPSAPFVDEDDGPYIINSNTRWNVFLQCVPNDQLDKIDECAPVAVD